MIYDSFRFYNEFDILEIRLEEHWEIVDKFVLVEAPFTQSYIPKPLYYKENKDKFKKYWEKIVPIEILGSSFHRTRHNYNDRLQRNDFKVQLDYNDDDIFILSDVDEILNSRVVREKNLFEQVSQHDAIQVNLSLHHYYVNYVVEGFQWVGPVISTGKLLRESKVSQLRKSAKARMWDVSIDNAGWHFSWMGGIERITDKMYTLCNKDLIVEYLAKMDFETRIKEGITFDYLTDGHKLTLDNNIKLPKYLEDNREKFSYMFRSNI